MNIAYENFKTLINNSKSLGKMELKAYCLTWNLHKLYNKARSVYTLYNDLGTLPDGMSPERVKQYCKIYNYFWHDPLTAEICDNLNKARRERTKRLNKKIEKMLFCGDCVFLTLTFKPEVLDNTTADTRRRYITRYLKSQSDHYCANIDYGKQNEREHYHAVVYGSRVDMTPWTEKYGFAYAEKIKYNGDAEVSEKLAKYVSKLTNHAIKNTARNNKVIYSTNWQYLTRKNRTLKMAAKDDTIATGLELFGDMLKVYQSIYND